MIIDSETINTSVGKYRIEWIHDDCAEPPYDEGFTLVKNGGRDRVNIDEGDAPSWLSSLILSDKSDYWEYEFRSGTALVRYLTMLGYHGVTLVDDDYGVDQPSANRFDQVHGVAWAPDDVPADKASEYVASNLAEWRAWAEGDTFGWRTVGPDGNELDSTWGYYGFHREQSYTRAVGMDSINHDVAQRQKKTMLAGAGFIGIL